MSAKTPPANPDRVEAGAFLSGWCPAFNMVSEPRQAASKFRDDEQFAWMDTDERRNLLACGINGTLYIDGKRMRTAPQPSYAAIPRRIAQRVGSKRG